MHQNFSNKFMKNHKFRLSLISNIWSNDQSKYYKPLENKLFICINKTDDNLVNDFRNLHDESYDQFQKKCNIADTIVYYNR